MVPQLRHYLSALVAAVLVAVGGIAIVFAVDDNGNPTVRVVVAPGADKPVAPNSVRDETPSGTLATDPERAQRAINESQTAADNTTTGPDVVPENRTLAAPHQRGCSTRLVRNFSGRNGARPALLVAHLTVSPNRPGWSDVDAVVNLFNSPRAQASSNYVIDNEGHCAFIVPETSKAWTQAFFNPWSISIEEINTGHERTYAGKKGLAKIGRVFADAGKRWGIPLRHGRVGNCRVLRAGIVQHKELGSCGGGHVDILDYKLSQVVRAARRARCSNRKTRRSRHRCARHLAR